MATHRSRLRALLLILIASGLAWAAAGASRAVAAANAVTGEDETLLPRYLLCRDINNARNRLQCYDRLAEQLENADRYSARGNELAIQAEAVAYQRLSSNEPNFFGYAHPVDEDLGDEPHLEFYLSQKYALVERWFEKQRYLDGDIGGELKPWKAWVPNRLFFIYNGQFDFYAIDGDRYKSSPVISRKHNPGLALEWDFRDPTETGRFDDPRKKLRFGYYHESNGQSLEPEEGAAGLALARREFQRKLGQHGEDFALAQVSRGWDYLSLRYEVSRRAFLADFALDWYQVQLEYRHFLDKQLFTEHREDAIWWDPETRAEIEDFDGLRFLAEKAFGPAAYPLLGRIEYKGGVSSFDALGNASWKLSLGVKALNTRFSAFYFNGYGREPSSYHLRTEYLGLGFEFR